MKLLLWCRVLNSKSCYRRSVSFEKVPLYSTVSTLPAPKDSGASITIPPPPKSGASLFRRIAPLGDWRVSIVSVLDQWIEEGRNVKKEELQKIIKQLRRYRRFKHALEVSQWMSGKRYFDLLPSDMAIRMDLISKVSGIEQAENYFNKIPKQARGVEVYGALLNCHVREKSLEKAEAIMQKMRDLELNTYTLCYNSMLNLYYQTGEFAKLESLVHEMKEKGLKYDKFTVGIRLSAYAASSNIEGMDSILDEIESDLDFAMQWDTYAIAANGYMKAGLLDKALTMLKKSEGLILKSKKNSIGFDFLLTQYAAAGKKDEVVRVWELYKEKGRIYNRGYMSIITSLLKFDDVEGAEKVFEEWESSQSCYDFRVPNYLIGLYCRKGLMEKALSLISKGMAKGGEPLAITWYYLATGYVAAEELPKAVEAMKAAISASQPGWKPSKETLIACLEYLKGIGDVDEAEEFVKSLGAKLMFSTSIQEKLLDYVKKGKSNSDAISLMDGDLLVGDGETTGMSDAEHSEALIGDEQLDGVSEMK